MEFTGKCIAVCQPKSGEKNGKSWCVQEFVFEETEGQYQKKVCVTVFGEDRIKEFGIVVGEAYKVSFDIDAREYNGRWFNSIKAYKVEKTSSAQSEQAPATNPFPPFGAPQATAPQNGNGDIFGAPDANDDMPF